MLNSMRFLSPPVEVHWMGWRSDTATLGRAGWDLSVQEDPERDRIQIAMRHARAQIYAMSEMTNHRYSAYRDPAMRLDLQFRMTLAHNISIHHMGGPIDLWKPADPLPTVTTAEIRSMDGMKIFRQLPPEEHDIILPPPSFDQILQMALEHQAPKQKELREKARRLTRGEQLIRVAA